MWNEESNAKNAAEDTRGNGDFSAYECAKQRLRIAIQFGGSDIMAITQFEASRSTGEGWHILKETNGLPHDPE